MEPVTTLRQAVVIGADDGGLVIKGMLDSESLFHLKVPDYQREVLSGKVSEAMLAAAKTGARFPDIDLAVRGDEFIETSPGELVIFSPVYIIDGVQRVNALRKAVQEGYTPQLGATAHLLSNEEWELERFRTLNAARVRVSPNVLIRNMERSNEAVRALRKYTNDPQSVLFKRVSWSQRMIRGEIFSALTLLKAVGALHGAFGPGASAGAESLAAGLSTIRERIGASTFDGNVRTFFELLDSSWGIRTVTITESASYLKCTFLVALARVFARHTDFWSGERGTLLRVERGIRSKIRIFPIRDPQVINLSGSGGKSLDVLYAIMVDHINAGKRTRRLTQRDGFRIPPAQDDDYASSNEME